ncbi:MULTISPECIES: substrate-binding domain-containing protein [unclassified Enterococcus]|uniref:substrate-binding domain-containing protein n=1 Tax=unclassified Enterococcus TaxID=2608891 RepID=UPI001554473D|nr:MULTISPECIES: substrate-binding domain-containing protein [unclassified Enterococcus]MBS7576667.1 substrate-binding domain-containing protein [Enterococcus sp. MMGLQ5-2]MBS7583846.1 substrate-binding domain-containing protein [Enterococcus sp. MMGLQ5-1]NPD11707.1 phosphate ABC transporter substrate-binding protein [Enterococcus sp. MMGLQ5-1]NPD36504.1 phosphate ABC transporter substrate-binding protein [Enterococcus sp. MMGLQ5-2]
MKKKFLFSAVAVAALALTGCGSNTDSDSASSSSSKDAAISIVTREDGSGTRGAFIELFGIEEKDSSGEKVDKTISSAEVTNSTSVMLTTIAGNENAIGYISLGSLNDTVKAVKIDGVEPSEETVKDGTYKISRPFNIVQKDTSNKISQDFIKYILSSDGQKVVEDNGYISKEKGDDYSASDVSGKITVAGSSSITPVMEKLKEAYTKLNPNVTIDIQQSDSTTGVSSTQEGIADIGMVSRELKDTETGLTATVIALDGIAVIVNNDQKIDDISADNVKAIYTGEITKWSEVK